MELIIFFLVLYILTGTIRVVRDFVSKDITSASYVRHPTVLMILTIILFWAVFPILRFMEQRRRMDFRDIFDFYLVSLFWGSSAYAASISGFLTILSSDSATPIKVLKIAGILIFFSVVTWWLFSRISRLTKRRLDI